MHKILIVDDVEGVCDTLKRLLERHGYEVEVATDLETARSKVKTGGFDLLIIDIVMPDGDGVDFASEVRSLEKEGEIADTGIIILTGYKTFENAEKSLNKCHADGLIRKPWDNKEVLELLNDYFKRRMEDDYVIKAFEEWTEKIDPEEFKIDLSTEEGKTKSLNAREILEEMRKGTEFGRNFRSSLIRVTAQMLKTSTKKKKS